ncbi:MAG: ATP-binding cassette domain-containing protein [Lachnospiraceae bacterium]|jgi:iron complex transport system ATP-binding protein|nr:ATP-binding cassette domain-containing protein [Lachnospiraceae bacterium]
MRFRVDKLTVGYDGAPLIRDISVTLEEGQILTLVGPNGSGKSTILKSIAGQLEPLGGAVFIGGEEVGAMGPGELARKMAVMFTDRRQVELVDCFDVVSMGRHPYTGALGILGDHDRAMVRETMEMCSVWDLAGRDFAKISDGQRQRVLLARALCQEPRVIILDEPTSFLDARYVHALLDTLKKLARQRCVCVILSLQQIEPARKISDLVMCVKGSCVFGLGKPQEVLTKENICRLYDMDEGGYGFMFGRGGSKSFFSNKECQYFPCHKAPREEDFNCLFCFCPLYHLGATCGGDFTYLGNGVKNCEGCAFPHHRGNYEAVLGRLGDGAEA